MAVTRLKRKGKRNKAVAKARVQRIKQLTAKPPVKNVDAEALKAAFTKKTTKKAEAAPAEEAVAE
jgi:hypothetical protein